MADSKSGGGGRSGRGRIDLNTGFNRPGSIANIMQQRVANRANLPKPIEARVGLEFRPINPVNVQTGRSLPKQVLDQMNSVRRPKFREQVVTIGFPSGQRATPRVNPLGR